MTEMARRCTARNGVHHSTTPAPSFVICRAALPISCPRIQMNRVDMRQVFAGLLVAALTCALVSCTGDTAGQQTASGVPSSGTQFFSVTGVVKELKPDGKMVVIQHEEIPNYMRAMTMPFEVRATNELAGLKPGDQISFRLLVTEKDGWIDQLMKLGSANV